MALLTVKTPIDPDWGIDDELVLKIGSENAADLAGSTPAGGVEVARRRVFSDGGQTKGGLGFDPLGGASGGPLGLTSIGYGLGEGELGYGALGLNDWPRAALEARHDSVDKCAALPFGVLAVDPAGNESAVSEDVAQLADPPRGPTNLMVASTGSPNEARLTWDASPDL